MIKRDEDEIIDLVKNGNTILDDLDNNKEFNIQNI